MRYILFMIFASVFFRLGACESADSNKYVVPTVYDSLKVVLPEKYEDQLCKVEIKSTGANFTASDYVREGEVKFDMRNIPQGRYMVYLRVGDIFECERIIKK